MIQQVRSSYSNITTRVHFILANTPGRLPAANHLLVPYPVTSSQSIEVADLSYLFWEYIFGDKFLNLILEDMPYLKVAESQLRLMREKLLLWGDSNVFISPSVILGEKSIFNDKRTYASALERIIKYLNIINASQRQFTLDIEYGIYCNEANYQSLPDLLRYIKENQKTIITKLLRAILGSIDSDVSIIFLKIKSIEELLISLMICREIKQHSKAHICLLDHGYENFSLHNRLALIQRNTEFFEYFDSICPGKELIESTQYSLQMAVENGRELPTGILDADKIAGLYQEVCAEAQYLYTKAFCPEQMVRLRLSSKRCYWDKCSYCVQNLKQPHTYSGLAEDVKLAVSRLGSLNKLGIKYFIFADEALSPKFLDIFCDELASNNLNIIWCCRCKIEKQFLNNALIAKIRQSGCREILFGIESISERMLKRMNKYVPEMTEVMTRDILANILDNKIGLHINLLMGHPGDREGDAMKSFDFLRDNFAFHDLVTYAIFRFQLIEGSDVYHNPHAYGIKRPEANGRLFMPYDYEVIDPTDESIKVGLLVNGLNHKLAGELPWLREMRQYAYPIGKFFNGSGHAPFYKFIKT